MDTLLDKVHTLDGDVIVTTKTKFLYFFNRPHTSVMPYGFSEFGRKLGFQARYNTSDPAILAELHEFYVLCVAAGGFQALMGGAKLGIVDFPDDKKHLVQYVIGFNA
jgi:hypothetical protein